MSAGAKSVVGVRTLEDLGLKVDPVSGRFEESRPKNVAYFLCRGVKRPEYSKAKRGLGSS